MQKNLRVPSRLSALLAFVLLPGLCLARTPDASECVEAGDFIKNAALARDGGMAEEVFLSRIRDDIEVIQAFPPHLRWFVQDEEDAAFLIAAATDVFQKPCLAAEHQRDFIRACMIKAKSKPKYSL